MELAAHRPEEVDRVGVGGGREGDGGRGHARDSIRRAGGLATKPPRKRGKPLPAGPRPGYFFFLGSGPSTAKSCALEPAFTVIVFCEALPHAGGISSSAIRVSPP